MEDYWKYFKQVFGNSQQEIFLELWGWLRG
jgi:hypothetical protein